MSEFTIRLPALADSAAGKPGPRGRCRLALRESYRVLVVDDYADKVRWLAWLPKHLRHEVRVANDGPYAVEVVRDHRPEIVLLDIGSPGVDG